MKTLVHILILSLALVGIGCGKRAGTKAPTVAQQQLQPARPAAEPPEQTPPPLLWRVDGPAGPVYLFGAMHFGVSDADLPTEVRKAMEESTTFVLEADPTTADPVELADLVVLPSGPSNHDRLGDQRWERLLEMLDGQFEERVANWLRPWVLEAALIEKLLPTEKSIELSLLETARERSMKIEFLESWQTQVELLNRVSTIESLEPLIDDPDTFKRQSRSMTRDYLAGDLAALERHLFVDGATKSVLFEERNVTWLPILADLIDRGGVFVTVGAGHLIGPHSVVEMLRKEGFEVTRIE